MNNELTQAELQVLQSVFTEVLDDLHQLRKRIKSEIADAYEQCDPDDSDTAANYQRLNTLKNYQKVMNRDYEVMAEIQRKIKRKTGGDKLGNLLDRIAKSKQVS